MPPVAQKSLPTWVRVSERCRRGSRLSGEVAVSRLPRVLDACCGDQGVLDVALEFGSDNARRVTASGAIRGSVELICQACLQAFVATLDLPLSWCLVESEAEEAQLLKDQNREPILVDDDRLELLEVLQDEVLLALPLAPRCERPECLAQHV